MPKTKIEKNIIEKIKKGQIKMKPKYYFVLGSISIVFGMLLSFLFSAFFINLISNRVRVHRMTEYLPMGQPGRLIFLSNFPWHFLFLTLIFLTIGAWLLKRYDISYKKSFLAITAGVIITTVCAGLIVDKAGINKPLQRNPGFRRLYDTKLKDKSWVIGTFVSKQNNMYIVKISDGTEIEVKTTKDTWIPPREFSVGECIRVVGETKNNTLDAFGITPCNPRNPAVKGRKSPERKTPLKMY